MCEDAFCPVKRRKALLGSNLRRDSWMQVALNNAAEGNGQFRLFPSPIQMFIQAFMLMP